MLANAPVVLSSTAEDGEIEVRISVGSVSCAVVTVGLLYKELSVPVTCKIRVYEDVAHTVEYARMLEAAGCQMLTVHGRTREQKGPLTGLANWEHIKAVSESVSIPVLANGNIQCLTDVARCLQETGCHGVMSAEGNLYNPALFEGRSPPAWELALEYLDLAERYPCPVSYVRGHLFKLFQHCLSLPENFDLRAELGTGSNLVDFRATVQQLKERYLPFDAGEKPWAPHPGFDLIHPPWLCHSYVRPAPEEHLKKMVEKQNRNADINQFGDESQTGEAEKENQDGGVLKRPREASVESAESKNMSKRRMKKLRKLKHKPNTVSHARRGVDKCVDCPNPVGSKCDYRLCKACCRTKCYVEDMDCIGHRIHTKSRREKAREYANIESRARALAEATTTEPVPDQTKPGLPVDPQSSADSVNDAPDHLTTETGHFQADDRRERRRESGFGGGGV
uniref:DUS-like FMN-binding domain-containing protein n=1 Tax=Timema genevievae TaxID=629358 RepID=A0A7R9JZ94_TIMGE|nr:unnamed protein product [Timema genevievae]